MTPTNKYQILDMYVNHVTRTNKAMMKKMTMTMSSDEIKQAKNNHAKKRQIIRQQKNKRKNKNKLNKNEII
uniref:Uncharacterized protein n=1 Tax=viral metagenome TaxID=1070528 RepID=A0A6C0LD22_9ZZZZ